MNGSITLLVSAVVVDAKDRILLTSHGPTWTWHLPDGAPRTGETLVDALKRSFMEDLGAAIEPEDQPCLVTETFGRGSGAHYVTCHFRCRLARTGNPLVPGPELRCSFFSEAEIAQLKISSSAKKVLADVFGWSV